MIKKQTRTRTRRFPKVRFCYFCQNHLEPTMEDLDTVRKFVSERGKITSRLRSGLCNRHQRQVTTTVKRARFLALIPFIVRPV